MHHILLLLIHRNYIYLFVRVDDISISVFRQPKQLYEDPRLRFQNSLRMLASARECARWVMREELANQMFYDAVVRSVM